MQFNFDLISDLHVETWGTDFDWQGQATSPYCIIAGDVARDHTRLLEILRHLSKCYLGVFYIDGNEEHKGSMYDFNESYQLLTQIKNIENVIYMQDNVVIINGVAILATNGWWSYDLDPFIDRDLSMDWHRGNASSIIDPESIVTLAYNDAAYMINSVKRLQTHRDVKKIIIVTHTVPAGWLVNHDPDLADTYKFNTLGNPAMQYVLDEDTENKIHTWCFGHYHKPVDRELNGVRYVNNCKGRADTPWKQSVYYPKRITIDL